MSPRKLRRVLAPRARGELRDVLLYTKQQWGATQRDTYRRQLFDGFDRLARYPQLGPERPEYGEGSRSYRIQHHIVISRATDKESMILRILHERRDIDHELIE